MSSATQEDLQPEKGLDQKTEKKALKRFIRRMMLGASRFKAPLFAVYGSYKLLTALTGEADAAEPILIVAEYTILSIAIRCFWTLFKTWYLVSHTSEDIYGSRRFRRRLRYRSKQIGNRTLNWCIAYTENQSNREFMHHI